MDSSQIGNSPAPEEQRRNWLDLPREVTASIMSRLVVVDVFTNVQFVCKAWLEISKDPLVWRVIDMSNDGDYDSFTKLDKMCRRAVDRSSGQVVDINIEYFVTDELLHSITRRPNRIERLRLAFCERVSDEGLIEALKELPFLEDLDLTLSRYSEYPIDTMRSSCAKLKSFRMNRGSDNRHLTRRESAEEFNREAYAITNNMPELRHLQLIRNSITNDGLEAILDGCSELESLDLRKCYNIRMEGDLWERCTRQIRHLRLPDDPTTDCEYSTGGESRFEFAWVEADNLFEKLQVAYGIVTRLTYSRG